MSWADLPIELPEGNYLLRLWDGTPAKIIRFCDTTVHGRAMTIQRHIWAIGDKVGVAARRVLLAWGYPHAQ